MIVSGQMVPAPQQKTSLSITRWLKAYNIFAAALLSSEETTKEEAAGLVAHAYLILQLSEDLQDTQWSCYDQSFCEWAAAKGLRRWGEINLTIYAVSHPAHVCPSCNRI